MKNTDFKKIPIKIKKQMKENAETRKKMITKRILEKFVHLKLIKHGMYKQS